MASLAESVDQLTLGAGDPYRDHLTGAAEKDTTWRHGSAPRYDVVNAMFEKGRTQVSSAYSLIISKDLASTSLNLSLRLGDWVSWNRRSQIIDLLAGKLRGETG